MIEIRYDPRHGALTLRGHAGAGAAGQDLVCCAVSMLTYTMAANVREMGRQKWLRRYTIHLAPGDAQITWEPEDGFCQAVRSRLDAVAQGLLLIQKDYPGFVTLYCPRRQIRRRVRVRN